MISVVNNFFIVFHSSGFIYKHLNVGSHMAVTTGGVLSRSRITTKIALYRTFSFAQRKKCSYHFVCILAVRGRDWMSTEQ